MAFRDDMDSHHLTISISTEAVPLLASILRSAGSRYPWPEFLPGLVARVLDVVTTMTEPTSADLRAVASLARRCVRDWIPLHELELCCQTVLTCLFRHVWAASRPHHCAEVLGSCGWAAALLPDVLTLIRSAYVEEMGRLSGDRRAELVIGALSVGGDAAGVARAAGLKIPEPCVVIALVPEPGSPDLGAPPAGLRSRLPHGSLCAVTPDGGALVALLPAEGDPESEPGIRDTAAALAGACGEAYGGGFAAGLATSAGPGEAAAMAEALAVGRLLAGSGQPVRAGFLLDVMVGTVLAERLDLRRRLTARLAVVRGHGQLWATLRALYECDLDRGRTARRLGIHRSTLDYRLGCVERLAGVSPTSVRGVVLFSAGLVADSLGP
ncbi:MAG TPA: helix-turn-helix domain-containing protein [Streptosporangiaceae bacterium]|nr:helix-turn-helix domain-containing protein [Streptosporangiaceae bacterium]